MRQKTKFKGGASTPHYKNTENCETIKMNVPQIIEIPMVHHIGAPCDVIVKKGERVLQGQCIGDTSKFVSAPVHASVSGKVRSIEKRIFPNGTWVKTVVIQPDEKMEISPNVKPPKVENEADFIKAIRASGVIGLGGAGFPTFIKLNVPKDKKVDHLLINASECEPYITSDYREMIESMESIVYGVELLLKYVKIKKVTIGIENNKPAAENKLKNAFSDYANVEVVSLKSRFPQGAEKLLIYALTKKQVPVGGLPLDVGVIVLNITTVSFIGKYFQTGMPLIKKRVTVDGYAVEKPANVEAYVGTPIEELLKFCGLKENPYKILMGGPMMGVAVSDITMPLLKQNNAILAFDKEQSILPKEIACIRCGKCVRGCPMSLMPLMLNIFSHQRNIKQLENYSVNNCMECGTCSYVCPAKRHLVQSIRMGKAYVRNKEKK